MADDDRCNDLDTFLPPLSQAAQRAGRSLMKLSEAELLAVLGVELQRRGLQELGALPKPRARPPRRLKPVQREQMLLLLPVHDDMTDGR
ncbi:hypothetical protein QTH97_16360 [Variovorax sp. J22R24]|uniref:hypothetical protein n=1 Tax=Variovorax gracilis TaxID=3053502 RepID=UPI0025760743|nr:hypothetical protein [Variovorax sp. J22R24]MDM0106520.1 hypothetical protein [Variovorax sp. J22R24]